MDTDLKRDPGWPGTTYSIPHCWLNSIIPILIVPHPEAVAAPVATRGHQEPPLEEGVMSGIPHCHSHLSHRSQSPEYWSPAPAAYNQHSFKYTLHSDTHRPIYRSPTWTSLTLSILTFMCLPSDPPVLLRSRSPLFLHDPDPPAKNPKSIITDKNQQTAICYCSPHLSIRSLIQPTCQ